jgi:hypothetical protein
MLVPTLVDRLAGQFVGWTSGQLVSLSAGRLASYFLHRINFAIVSPTLSVDQS